MKRMIFAVAVAAFAVAAVAVGGGYVGADALALAAPAADPSAWAPGVGLAMSGMVNLKASEQVAVVGNIDPDAYAAGAVSSGWIDASKFHNFLALVQAGDLGTSATLDGKLEQASDSSGTGAKDITGKAITQLTQAGTDSNKQAEINLRPEELDVEGGFTHFRLTMTVATATSDAGGVVLGVNPRDGFASANDASTVDEIV